MENIFYNYIYLDPRKPGRYSYPGLYLSFLYEPFYVGKGKEKRCYDHLSNNYLKTSSSKNDRIKAIKELFNIKDFIILFNIDMNEITSLSQEEYLIRTIGLLLDTSGCLTNQSYGGFGGLSRIVSDKEKQSRSDNHWMKGKTYDELYGKEKALKIKKQRSMSLKGHSCYKSKSRSAKISSIRKNKSLCYHIPTKSFIEVDSSTFMGNQDLLRNAGNKGKAFYLLEVSFDTERKLYFRSLTEVRSFFKISEGMVNNIIKMGIYRFPKRGSRNRFKSFEGMIMKKLTTVPDDYYKHAVFEPNLDKENK